MIRILFSFEYQLGSIFVEIPITAEYWVYRAYLGYTPYSIAQIFSRENRFCLLIQRRDVGASARLPFKSFF